MAFVSGIYGIDPKQAVAHVKVFPRPGTLRQMEKSKNGAREGLLMRKAIDAVRRAWTGPNEPVSIALSMAIATSTALNARGGVASEDKAGAGPRR